MKLNEEKPKGDSISREALKKTLKEKFDDFIPEGLYDEIDNAPTVKPCENCDLYFKAMTKAAELDKMPMISKKHKGGEGEQKC